MTPTLAVAAVLGCGFLNAPKPKDNPPLQVAGDCLVVTLTITLPPTSFNEARIAVRQLFTGEHTTLRQEHRAILLQVPLSTRPEVRALIVRGWEVVADSHCIAIGSPQTGFSISSLTVNGRYAALFKVGQTFPEVGPAIIVEDDADMTILSSSD